MSVPTNPCTCKTDASTYRVESHDGYVRPRVDMCRWCAAFLSDRGYKVTKVDAR